ncbi:MAG: CRISPR-associated protein Cas6 [Bacteroidetes bacterium]|jgi:CRISPR-associated endoribonuclease Cas6|nr:CRISPR-associated protein Cas6 [Bacteroidota bacterium]
MRLNLKLTGNTEPVPFDHLHHLTGALHKWLGENRLHDGTSLYSFGWLEGATAQNGHLTFPRGAGWRVSFHDPEAAKALLDGILCDPTVFAGMRVFEAQEQATPQFSGCYRFLVDGPVIARREREDGSKEYLLWDDDGADAALTRVLRWKLRQAGFTDQHQEATVQFDRTYTGARSKLAHIKGIAHKGSECPVVVTGTPEAVRFAWTVGVGELTGSGFGALR